MKTLSSRAVEDRRQENYEFRIMKKFPFYKRGVPIYRDGVFKKLSSFIIRCFLLLTFSLSHFLTSVNAWEIIDIPTTQPVDAYTYRLGFRFYAGGGVLTRATFGVFRNINIGFAWDMKKLIGREATGLVPPSVHLKILLYEGSKNLPSFAIGYDGQGYHWNKDKQLYEQREKGVYIVISREVLTPDFELTLGGNINDFRTAAVYGFVGFVYTIDKLSLLVEYDNIHTLRYNRLNAGLRLSVVPELNFELVVRDITKSETIERIIKVNYTAKF